MKKWSHWSLKTQFGAGFLLVLLLSLVATAITYVVGVLLYSSMEFKGVYPANYYEKQLPKIKAYIKQANLLLLHPDGRSLLEEHVSADGFRYQVLDGEGELLYGTMEGTMIEGREALYDRLNTQTRFDGRYVQTVPVIGKNGRVAGAVLLGYTLSPTYAKGSGWMGILYAAVLLSPFLYILLFTALLARRLARRINQPLSMLMEASRKIANKDLDFEIGYRSDNELGQLCTAFSQMQSELRTSLSAQWRLEREQAEMSEALAHDLKTPLSIISGYAEALLDSEGDAAKRQRYLTVIRDNAGKSARLVRQMQLSADLERSDGQLVLTTVPVVAWTEALLKQFELEAESKGIRLQFETHTSETHMSETHTSETRMSETHISEAQPPGGHYAVDTEKLERILGNILMNSMAYTPPGGRIEVKLQAENRILRFLVRDTGPGFARGDWSKVFDRFYRSDKARGIGEGHSGLGLYIAKRLVQQHGGDIIARNADGGGAEIVFSIQASQAEYSRADSQP